MARSFLPKDGYAIMTALTRQATGQSNISVVDMSSFVSAGETVMATGKENVYNALSVLIGRTLIAARTYNAKLALMNALETGSYTNRLRKISFYSKDPLPSGFFNTDLFTNLADGFTAGENPDSGGTAQSTKSQWEQHQSMPLEMNFAGSTVWDHCITLYEEQVDIAFRDPVELAQFVAGKMIEHNNEIASTRESFNRMTLCTKIGQCYLYDKGVAWSKEQVYNLTSMYNAFYGTNYTSAQLRSTYLKSFLEFMTATIKEASDRFTERTANHHLPMTKTVNGVNYSVLRHVPRDRQRLYLYRPLFRKAEAIVMPEIFNTEYLSMTQYEGVDFWQSNYSDAERPQIKVRVPFYNKGTGVQESSGDIELPYVVGLLTDVDGMMTDFQLERALTTQVEARKGYRNTWLHIAKNAITDPTESACIFIMTDEDVTPGDGGDGGDGT